MTRLSMSSRSSVDRAPARCLGGHEFKSCWDADFFLGPTLALHYFHKMTFVGILSQKKCYSLIHLSVWYILKQYYSPQCR